jgi:hypothetical protein
MEDKSSFYEFLAANSKLTNEEKKKIHPVFLLVSWLIIFVINSSVLYLGWNYAVAPLMHFEHSTFLQTVLFYSAFKVLIRGFFSAQ